MTNYCCSYDDHGVISCRRDQETLNASTGRSIRHHDQLVRHAERLLREPDECVVVCR